MRISPKFIAMASGLLLALLAIGAAQAYDPPQRVARLSYTDGKVSVSPAGEREWLRARRNRPHVRGDRFWTDARSRAELQMGSAVLRLDQNTGAEILNLDDRVAQFELTQGTMNLRVRRLYQGQSYEIDTPTLAFVVTQPGEYRIDVDPRGAWTEVVVIDGQAIAYGERARFPLREGDAIRFNEPTLRDYDVFAFPRPDSFDRFSQERNVRLERSVALRYVPDDMIGYSDLDEYGTWSSVRDYGNVWFPTRVDAGWAPYRNGNWIWQDPWGWTWVDEADWGFAPFHYGRWVQVDRRWGWVPSSRRSRPVYAPALVAFLGDGNGYGGGREPIGWFPLGPRDVYMPSYRASREYFTQVNTGYSGLNNTLVNNAYSGYSSGRPGARYNYMHRDNQQAVTAVPGDVFVNARSVRGAALPYNRSASAFSEASHIAAMAPTARSVTGPAGAAAAQPSRGVFERPVVAHSAPPPADLPFDARREALGRNPGRPLEPAAIDALRGRTRGRAAEDIRVVGDGAMIQRPQNEARDATRELERMGGVKPDPAAREAARGQRLAEPTAPPAAPTAPPAEPGNWERGRDGDAGRAPARPGETIAPEGERGRRGADSGQREQEGAAQQQAEAAQRDAQRQQQEAEQAQRALQRQQQEAEQAQREMQQQQQEGERARQERERETRRQQQEVEQAGRQVQQQQQENERAQREQAQDVQRQQQEAERAGRQLQQEQQAAERVQRDQEREAQQQQQEAAQAQRQAQQQQQEAAQAQRQEQQQQQEAAQAQRQMQQQQQEAERAAQQQAQAEQREAARREREASESEDDKEGKDKEWKRDRDDGGGRP